MKVTIKLKITQIKPNKLSAGRKTETQYGYAATDLMLFQNNIRCSILRTKQYKSACLSTAV